MSASTASQPYAIDRVNRRLVAGLLLSMALHALLLLLQFGAPAMGGAGLAPLRLVLKMVQAPEPVPKPVPVLPAPAPQGDAGPAVVQATAVPAVPAADGFHLVAPRRHPVPPAAARRPRPTKRISPISNRHVRLHERVIVQEHPMEPTFVVPLPEIAPALETSAEPIAMQDGAEDGQGTAVAKVEQEATEPAVTPTVAEPVTAPQRNTAEDVAANDQQRQLAEQAQLRVEQERQVEEQASQLAKVQAQRQIEEEQARQQAAAERAGAEAQARQAEAERQHAEQLAIARREQEDAARRDAELVVRERAEQLAQQKAAEELATRREAEALAKQQAEEARQRAADDLARQQAAEQARQRAADELARQQAEEQARQRAAEELARQQAAEQARQRVADELAREQAAEQARQRVADELARQAAAERARLRAAEELARQQAEQARQRLAAAVRPATQAAQSEPTPGGGSGIGPGLGAGGAGTSGPRAMSGNPLASRAHELLRGLDILKGAPPAASRADEQQRADRRVVANGTEPDLPLRFYVDSFRQKIERNGTLNRAQLSAQRVRIDPVVSVALRSDGSVADVLILRSSGHPDTDEAVRRIVRLNERFAAFPPNVAARFDIIEIRRIWVFAEGLKLLEEVR